MSAAEIEREAINSYPTSLMGTKSSSTSLTPKQFGERLKFLRVMGGHKAAAFARILGVTDVTLYSWESGKTVPRFDTCMAIARALKVTPQALLAPLTDKEQKDHTVRTLRGTGVFDLLRSAAA